jgi:small nuclear ribonucleoprotein (snRNP)-like protein
MKGVCLLLVILLIFSDVTFADQAPPVDGTPQAQTQALAQVEKVKERVQKRGVGETVRVTLVNESEVKGSISEVDEASFVVTDKNSGRTTTVPYAEVQKVQGPGLYKGAKIAITAAVVIGVLAIVAVIFIHKADEPGPSEHF